MINSPTLFILGAGASVPYGYPTGFGLKEQIIKEFPKLFNELLTTDPSITDKKRDGVYLPRAEKFVKAFSDTVRGISIDQWLQQNDSFRKDAKIAIALCILKCEEKSPRYGKMEPEDIAQDWYTFLVEKMSLNRGKLIDLNEFFKNDVTFITFNYDRSLDHFIYEKILANYEKAYLQQFEESLKKKENEYIPFPIIHVYNSLEEIKWHGGSRYKEGNYNFETIDKLSENILVIGEERNNILNERIKRIRALVQEYKKIMFLGFGFLEENLDILGLPEGIQMDDKIYGTTIGMSSRRIKEVKDILFTNTMAHKRILEDKNCYELLEEYLG